MSAQSSVAVPGPLTPRHVACVTDGILSRRCKACDLGKFTAGCIPEIRTTFRVLTFCDNLYAPVLAEIYAAVPEVEWADPNWFIGIDDYITITEIGAKLRYDIDDGFQDCFDGCDCHRLWVIDVDLDGVVTLISYTEEGYPWCEF